MKTVDFDIRIPSELIAQTPCEPRDYCRMFVVDRGKKEIYPDFFFYDLPLFLHKGDVLVLNNSRVTPARFEGHKESSPMEKITLLLLREVRNTEEWEVLTEVGTLEQCDVVVFTPPELKFKVTNIGEKVGKREERIVHGVFSDSDLLEKYGQIPIPPYIHGYKGDPENYQNVYSSIKGSAACPTAGLHFTKELLETLSKRGVILAFITLHVGVDTFMPVYEEEVEDHKIYEEYLEVPGEVCKVIKEARQRGSKITCVGTTTVRALESSELLPTYGWTDKYIYPGYKFQLVDQLITNFQYPRSSNLILIAAFAGIGLIRKAYTKAVESKYRFYSFGDAFLIL